LALDPSSQISHLGVAFRGVSDTEAMIRGVIAIALGLLLGIVTALTHSPWLSALSSVGVVVVIALLVIRKPWRHAR